MQSRRPLPIFPKGEPNWQRWRDIPLALLAWTGVVLLGLWLVSHVLQTLMILIVAMLLAHALQPLVLAIQRVLPRVVAVGVVAFVVVGTLGFLFYLISNTALRQLIRLTHDFSGIDTSLIVHALKQLGFTQQQIDTMGQQVLTVAQSVLNSIVPVVLGTLSALLNVLVGIVLTIYFLLDGHRVAHWLRTRMPLPQQTRVNFLLDTLERVVGGYIRGQLVLASMVGVLVGAGMEILQIPYAVLLGALAFVLEFIPYIGTLASGVICVLVALTQGWLAALAVLLYFAGVHILEGYVVGPRVVGRAVGLHPAVSLVALIMGAELFGPWGAIFAAPTAGVLQAFALAFWRNWHTAAPEIFPTVEEAEAPPETPLEPLHTLPATVATPNAAGPPRSESRV